MNAPAKKKAHQTKKYPSKAQGIKGRSGRAPSSKKQVTAKAAGRYPWALLAICIFMLFLLLTDNWTFKLGTQFIFAAGAGAIFIGTFVFRENRRLLFKQITKIAAVLLAQCVLYFIMLFYASYPKFALQQFNLNIGAFMLFTSAYVSILRSELNIRMLTKLMSYFIAAASLISIELATSGLLRPVLSRLGELLNAQLPASYGAFETNTRITTVLGAPNAFAPVAVFGMFAAIWNFGRPGERSKTDFLHLGLAVVCGTAFVLCFSLGTILSYIVMLAVFVFVTGKGERGGQLPGHLFCLAVSLIAASAVFALRDKSLLPLLAVIVISAGAAYAYSRVKPIKLPAVSGAAKKGIGAGILAVCIVFAVCAAVLQHAYALDKSDSFRRAVAVKPGTYTFSAIFDGAPPDAAVSVEISSMSYAEAALKEKTVLTTASLKSGEPAVFEVPEASAAVFVGLTAGGGMRIESAEIRGDGLSKQLPLKYLILPEFIVNRLQGLWVNDNAIQRFIFFRDGIRLGLRSPVFGLGGGAFEGGLDGAADYYYQTKHSHNEYIERFAEGGIIGAALFIGLTVLAFRALYMARKSEKIKRLAPFLTACMVMVFFHALIEVDFLFGSYRAVASLLFALVAALCGDTFKIGRRLKAVFITAGSAVITCAVLLLIGRYAATKLLDSAPNLQSLQTAMALDPLNRYDYKLSYLLSTKESDKPPVIETQEKYLASMENSVVGYEARAQFLLTKRGPDYDRGIAVSEAYIRSKKVNPEAWDTIFSLYDSALDAHPGDAAAAAKIAGSYNALGDYLNGLNETLPKKIQPNLAVYTYLRMQNPGAGTGDTILDSRTPCDLDLNGTSDLIGRLSGETAEWSLKASLTGAYEIRVYQKESAACEIKIDGSALTCTYDPDGGYFYADVRQLKNPVSILIITTDAYPDGAYFTIGINN